LVVSLIAGPPAVAVPTATQCRIEVQLTAVMFPAPAGALCVVQVEPPSVVTMIPACPPVRAPTAVQLLLLGQLTPVNRENPVGTVSGVQVLPLVVTRMYAALLTDPTATQSVVPVQAIPERLPPDVVSTGISVHDVPLLVELIRYGYWK
jgi:hypothetical protein